MNEGQGEPENSDIDERERVPNEREAWVEAFESHRAEREATAARVRRDADDRDAEAAARDLAAGERDMAANLRAWLCDDPNQGEAEARGEARDDRLHSSADRKASAEDRSVLAEDDGLSEYKHPRPALSRCLRWQTAAASVLVNACR